MPGYATPPGRFRVTNKAVDPAKARWLGIVDGIGIHGTAATWSLGRRASHGCIRMAVPAVKRVYDGVPVGALVMIK